MRPLEDELHEELLDAYFQAGEEVGYWGRRFKQSVDRNGGLATVRRMLEPRSSGQRKGLDALLAAGRPDLTVEAVVAKRKYARLFTLAERRTARERLTQHKAIAKTHQRTRERLYPDEIEPGRKYIEGAKKQVRVNAYERDARARRACVAHHGTECSACDQRLEDIYGPIARGFIHVHHLKPLAKLKESYAVDPIKDLVPVCPNCHAMLHRTKNGLSVQALRQRLEKRQATVSRRDGAE